MEGWFFLTIHLSSRESRFLTTSISVGRSTSSMRKWDVAARRKCLFFYFNFIIAILD